MKRILTMIVVMIESFSSFCQNEQPLPDLQFEFQTQSNELNGSENLLDELSQKNIYYTSNPVDLNSVEKEDLEALGILNVLQIESFLSYRNTFGKLIHKYEMQSIPMWDIPLIEKLQPYVYVKIYEPLIGPLKEFFKDGNSEILCRVSGRFNPQNSASTIENTGSSEHLSLRFKKIIHSSTQFGITADKDEGEQLFNKFQKNGFDFYSAHFFKKGKGVLKAIALGDFTVNIGQGLMLWQSNAFGKVAEITMLRRQAEVLKPYSSFGENNFQRGLGITVAKKKFESSFFVSYRKQDAKIIYDSTESRNFISSISTTGLHRTITELENKGNAVLLTLGTTLNKKFDQVKISINCVYNRFDKPLLKSTSPSNLFKFFGSELINYGFDYNATIKNMHAFGEVSLSSNSGRAITQGIITSVSRSIDFSFLYRHFSKDYWALNANAVAENSSVNNESGLFSGIVVRPANQVRLSAYFDQINFQWLKYNLNTPDNQQDYLIETEYKPSKSLSVTSRYRAKSYNINNTDNLMEFKSVGIGQRKSWRTQFEMQLTPSTKIKNRVEFVWLSNDFENKKEGALFQNDLYFKPKLKKFSCNFHCTFFETEGYDTRIYGYENDFKNSNSMVVYFGKGVRLAANIGYKIGKGTELGLKWGKTFYFYSQFFPTEQRANQSEIKFQVTRLY